MNYNGNNRNIAMDIAKGIGILLVVLGHLSIPPIVHKIIYLFHMPLFFFISGYFLMPKYDRFAFVKSKVNRLIIPIILYSIFLIPFFILGTNIMGFSGITFRKVLESSIPFTYDIPLWFSPVLLISILIVNEFCLCQWMVLRVLLFITLLSGIQLNILGYMPLIPYILKTLVATLFLITGFYTKRKDLSIMKLSSYKSIIFTLVVLIGLAYCSYVGIEFDLANNIMSENLLLIILPAFGGILLVLLVSNLISEYNSKATAFFSYLGRNSFPVYCLHWPVIKVASQFLPPPSWDALNTDVLSYVIMRWVFLIFLIIIFVYGVEAFYRKTFPCYFQ